MKYRVVMIFADLSDLTFFEDKLNAENLNYLTSLLI